MKDVVTKAHHMCWEDLQQDLMKNSDARMQFITVHKEMSLKSVLTHKGFVSQLAPDEEIQQLLEEIWGEAHDEELQRELPEDQKTLPQPLAEQHFQDRFWRRAGGKLEGQGNLRS